MKTAEKETVRVTDTPHAQEVNDAGKREFEKALSFAAMFAKQTTTPIWNVND